MAVDPQLRRDADAIYERAIEFHNVLFISDAHELGKDWKPIDQVAKAIALLVEEGFAELDTFRGRRLIRLTNPILPAED